MEWDLQLKEVREAAAIQMAAKARELGVHGVSVVETSSMGGARSFRFWTTTTHEVDSSWDPPEATKTWSPTGANYRGLAYGKIAQTHRTGKNASISTSADATPLGEAPWSGCLCLQHRATSTIARISFSGGTEEEDLEISHIGVEVMATMLNGLRFWRGLIDQIKATRRVVDEMLEKLQLAANRDLVGSYFGAEREKDFLLDEMVSGLEEELEESHRY